MRKNAAERRGNGGGGEKHRHLDQLCRNHRASLSSKPFRVFRITPSGQDLGLSASRHAVIPARHRIRYQSRMIERQSVAPSFKEALAVWAKIGVLSFGGPAGQIALMHRVLVDERRWIGEERFLHALNFCMLLPGPEAMQLATYVGWRLHGTRGRACRRAAVRAARRPRRARA